MRLHKKKFTILFYLFLVGGALFLLAIFYFSKNLPTIEQISNRQISQSTKIYDRTGSTLLYEISNGRQRTVVPLEEIPKYLRDATISIEDESFYKEPAFNWRGVIRAIFVNLIHGKILQGGSTITQQLAKNAFLTPEQTLTRKIREFILASKLNRNYSKDQILALYLNEIPYGPTAYGVESASETYFGKPVRNLNLAEGALIAALPKAPTYYSPWGNHVKELINRQKIILEKMFKLGKIGKGELDEARKFKPSFAPQSRGIRAPHFVMAVQDYLVQKYGEGMVREGGLRVTTTLDWDLERLAEKSVASGAAQNEKLYKGKNAALVVEDPKTGQILAMVGSRDYFDLKNEGNFDVATQGLRQPGSTLKPFVYLTAFEKGFTPETVVFDVPTEFASQNPACPPNPDFENDNPECFHPENFDGLFRGPVSLRQALAQSINIPAVKVLYLAGLNDAVKNANRFGLSTLTSPNLYGLSLVLGGGAVKLIDLVGAYSALATDGIRHQQSLVLEIKDSTGRVLESYADRNERAANPEPTRLINSILSDTAARSGLFQNSLNLTVFPDRDVALKTGTSNDYRDAWALGYTPSLVVGVWAGNNDNSPMQRHGSSILAAVPIWHEFMSGVIKSLPQETFGRPDPPSPQKPVLAGDYLHNKQIHSILYYVSRSDPQGPQPQIQANDPQFSNWEYGVLAWAEKNLPDFKDYNKAIAEPIAVGGPSTTIGTGTAMPPKIVVEGPVAGEFVGDEFRVSAKISSVGAMSKLIIHWNGRVVKEFVVDSKTNYDLVWLFAPSGYLPQNLLEIEAVGQNGVSGWSSVIVYSK